MRKEIIQLNTHNKLACVTLVALAAVFFVGCAATKRPEYSPTGPTASARVAEQDGLMVALDPFVERERCQKYFGIDGLKDGIGIVHVFARNESTNRTFLVRKENFQLHVKATASEVSPDVEKIDRSTAAGDSVAITGAVLGSYPMLFAGASMLSHAKEVERNFVSQEMPDETLSPGESLEGFVYFSGLEKKKDWTYEAWIRVSATDVRTHETVELTIPVTR